MKTRGFEIAKGWEDKGINLPVRKTKCSAGYDVEAAEDVNIPVFTPGCKPTLTGSWQALCRKGLWPGPIESGTFKAGHRPGDLGGYP